MVHLIAAVGLVHLLAEMFPEGLRHQIVAFYAALWIVACLVAVVAAVEEWRWRERWMRESGKARRDGHP